MVDEELDWTGVEALANEAEAELLAGFLREHDIPARVVDASFHQAPNPSEDLTRIEVAVPTHRLEEAQAVLAKRNLAFTSGESDSERVMTDEGLADVDALDSENG